MGDFDDDAAKYEAMRAELDAEDGLAPAPPRMDEADTIVNPQPPQPQPRYEPEPLPDVTDDPIGHFQGRVTDLEGFAHQQHAQAQGRQMHDLVMRDEAAAEKELHDYWDACAHLEQARAKELEKLIPDTPEGHMYAQRAGLPNAAAARAAQLNLDRQQVAAWAIQNGQSPAAVYYGLAQQRGYRSKVDITPSQTKALAQLAIDDPAAFDKAWAVYEKSARRAEQNRRR
ncbi:MAG TPA: hypothetical protein VGF29_00830 [Hyphomicrobiaceae bacterium]|jgi:hypothetical protein